MDLKSDKVVETINQNKELIQKLYIISLTVFCVTNHILFFSNLYQKISYYQIALAIIGFLIECVIVVQFIEFFFNKKLADDRDINQRHNKLIVFVVLHYIINIITYLNNFSIFLNNQSHGQTEAVVNLLYLILLYHNLWGEKQRTFLLMILTLVSLNLILSIDDDYFSIIRTAVLSSFAILLFIIYIIGFKKKKSLRNVTTPRQLENLQNKNNQELLIEEFASQNKRNSNSLIIGKSCKSIISSQRQARQQQQQQMQFDTPNFIEKLNTGLIILDNNLQTIYFNQIMNKILQLKPQEDIYKQINLFLYQTKVSQIDSQTKSQSQFLKSMIAKSTDKKNVKNDFLLGGKSSMMFQSGIASHIGLKKKHDLNLCLAEFIRNLKQENKFKQQSSIHVINFESPCVNPNNYQITIEFQAINQNLLEQQQIIIQFFDTNTHDRQLKRRFTYKLMKRLFKSFSHEYGTSLNCIMALTSAAMNNNLIPAIIKEQYFQSIEKSALLLLSITNDIRDFNHVLGKTFTLTYNQAPIKKIIDSATYLFEDQIQKKGISLQVTIEDDVPTIIQIDHDRLKQVLVNLISNSTKFTYKGGISINIKSMKKDLIFISVNDTGIGMTVEELARLQDVLHNGFSENTISSNCAGYGLGMFISNQIARHFSCSKKDGLQINSMLASGTTVSFEVQIQKDWDERFQEEKSNIGPYIVAGRNELVDARSIVVPNIYINNIKQRFSKRVSMLGFQPPLNGIKRQSQIDPLQLIAVQNKINLKEIQESIQNLNEQKISINSSSQYEIDDDESNSSINSVKITNVVYGSKTGRQMALNCSCAKILVVDDEIFNIYGIQKMLEIKKIKIDSANNGVEALQKIDQKLSQKCMCGSTSYQIILMDVNMPIKDGLQTSLEIRQLIEKQIIKECIIIACTAFVDLKTKTQVFEAKMDHYLSKPIQFHDLIDVLKQYEFFIE